MRLFELVNISHQVAHTRSRREKVRLLAQLLARLDPDEIPLAVGFLTGWPVQGRLGIGWAAVRAAMPASAAVTPRLDLRDVHRAFDDIVGARGAGSSRIRGARLQALFDQALPTERDFLSALIRGEVRHGALEGVLAEAVAAAAALPASAIRRALMLAGDLGNVAAVALTAGEPGLARYRVRLFTPLQPMLADSAADLADALERLGSAAWEYKLDGARVQVHKAAERVQVYTRNLNDVTAAVPEVVAAVRELDAGELILDGEVLALDRDGRPHPFQVTMRRFGRRLDVAGRQAELPVRPFFFDLLLLEGVDLLDLPASDRWERLARVVPADRRVPRLVTGEVAVAARFQADAVAQGHEGVMAKALDAPYTAGRRGSAWLKVKAARTLDLVVLAAEWGAGRRTGWLSNLHLGARDPALGFVMLGKTFKGMTDEMLEWQTRELLARETHRDDHTVFVRPELVVEVAFNEIQSSTQYPGGVTLRFARVKGYRPDKSAADADTIDTVRSLR